VWKRIAALRGAGYVIDGRRSDGYTLAGTPDRIGPVELAPHLRGAWRTVHWFEETDSTQRVARDLARGGAPEGTVVLAERQTAGRGRLGRTWHSPPGLNVYASIVLRPPLAPGEVPRLALVVGAAVAAAIADQVGASPAIKWPNDVLLDGRKIAGVLVEMDAEMERVHHVIAGIGVNVNAPLASFPPDLRDKATSLLAATGRRVDRAAFAARLLVALEARYGRFVSGGFDSVRAEWERFSCLTGTDVRVAGPDGEVAGRVLGLDDDGALRLARPDGSVVRVIAGEVTVRDGYRR
jgi:BirA family biotin operon repressor/biotin-[acetyl-CoA-carboxylase] ligase